jgi:large subunit ribosomal protein L25
LPTQIPGSVDLDVSGLQINDTLRVSDLLPIEGVEFLDDPDALLVMVSPPTIEAVPEPTEEEGEEGAEPGEETEAEAEAETDE